jgi:hypothetical protein
MRSTDGSVGSQEERCCFEVPAAVSNRDFSAFSARALAASSSSNYLTNELVGRKIGH